MCKCNWHVFHQTQWINLKEKSRRLLTPWTHGGKLNAHRKFRKRPEHFLIISCMFNLRLVSKGGVSSQFDSLKWLMDLNSTAQKVKFSIKSFIENMQRRTIDILRRTIDIHMASMTSLNALRMFNLGHASISSWLRWFD